jgi:hypothetical protein
MPNLKLQVSRALNVIKSSNTNIPMPNVITTSSTTNTAANKLVDSTKNFSSVGNNALNIQVGDIVYNYTALQAAVVTNVDSATQLSLNVNIMATTQVYKLFSGTNTAGSIEPCVLYVGTGGSLNLTTAGGDIVDLLNVPSGTFLPIQTIKISGSSSASDIVALW